MYAEILDREQAPAILDDVVGTPPPTLVHCTAGKDRTGVLVAVLLRAAGVTASAVIADHARTTAAMEGVRARLPYDESVEELIREFPEVLAAPRDAIQDVLRPLERHPGGVPWWLVENGVEREVLTTCRRRLVAPGGPPGPHR